MAVNVTGVHGTMSQFKYGDLISNIIEFVIILLVFIAYKVLEDKTKPEEKKT